MKTTQTERQRRMLQAIDDGARTIREIMAATGTTTTSVVSYNLLTLANRGDIELEETNRGLALADWQGFAAGWDAAAWLAGNPEA